MSEAPEVYDPVDLRQRIVVCFTIGELRELAEQLGVAGSVAWQRGIHEAARGVVQQCERYAGLPALVAKLRDARPDMDWPTASPPPVEPVPAASPPEAPAGEPARPAEPGEASGAAQAAIADPFASAAPTVPGAPIFTPVPPLSGPGSLGPTPTTPASFAAPPVAVVKSPPRVPSPYWPGTAAEPAPPVQRGLDPRILVAVAGLMLVAAVVAYFAGRASSPSAAEGAAAASATPLGPRGNGPAARAADAIDRRIASLARVCELPPGRDRGELVFARVFDRCGPPAPRRPRSPLPDVFDVDAGAAEPPSAEPAAPAPPAARPRRQGGRATAPTEAPPTPSRSCEGTCTRSHQACKTNCGPEPTEAGGYQGYQRCLSRCLSDASHCRLACR